MHVRLRWPLTLLMALALSFATGPTTTATHTSSPTPRTTTSSGGPLPPEQPATGPGSEETLYERVVATHFGPDDLGYWIFEPADPVDSATPTPEGEKLPIVLFLTGCCSDEEPYVSGPPEWHPDWIAHLVHRGNIVVFPIYAPDGADAQVNDAMRAALAELESGGHARPDLDRFAVFGASFGGTLAANYAATAAASGLPEPAAMMVFGPGCDECALADLSKTPAATRFLLVVSAEDDMVTEERAKEIWAGMTAVPEENRNYIRIRGDDHGSPPLVANHPAPTSGAEWATLDALDWYGFWKPFDALLACTFDGQWCEFAFGNTPEQRFMGLWSDGVPVNEAEVTTEPGPPTG